jgi:uncharacterized protein YraI
MKPIVYAIVSALCFAPIFAQAGEAVVVADIPLQSGPDSEYPPIGDLAAGTPVAVQGCIEGWSWCDVIAGGDRGWVPGTYLEENYGGQNVAVIDYGPRISIPIVTFSIGGYWDHYYRSRPFYGQRTEWEHRDIHPHAPPRAPAHDIHPQNGQGSHDQNHHDARNDPHQQNMQDHHEVKPVNPPHAVNQANPTNPPHAVATTPPHPTPQHVEREPAAHSQQPVAKPPPPHAVAHPPTPTAHEAAPKPPQQKVAPKAEPKQEPRKEPAKEEKHEGGGR